MNDDQRFPPTVFFPCFSLPCLALLPGHEVFAVLTHIDAYTPEGSDDSDSEEEEQQNAALENSTQETSSRREKNSSSQKPLEAGAGEFDREAELPGIVSLW